MSKSHVVSRRTFLASTSGTAGFLFAGNRGRPVAAREAAGEKLALEGGPKAVTLVPPSRPRWGEPELRQLEAMLRQNSLFYWDGPQTQLLTERFQEVCPVKYVQTCSSGTAALHIAVSAAGIGPGDEVITTPITDMGTVIGVIYQQAVPVFADLGTNTYNLDPANVARRITSKTKAIIAVHLAGNPCDLDTLKAIADRHNLILIEDCCQAWGAKYKGRPIGTVGHFACFSLQNSKHITCGDGGVVGTNDERFGPLLQKFGDKGGDRRKWGGFDAFATNYRMSEPQAAVAAAQLTRLESIVAARSRLGNLLTELIADAPGVVPHGVRPDDRAVYWFYMFRLREDALRCNRSQFIRAAAAEGANLIGGYIAKPLYQEPVFQNHGFFAGRWPVKEMGLTDMDFTKHSCPEAEAILTSCVRVLINENMTEEYIRQLAAAIQKVARYYAV